MALGQRVSQGTWAAEVGMLPNQNGKPRVFMRWPFYQWTLWDRGKLPFGDQFFCFPNGGRYQGVGRQTNLRILPCSMPS